MGNQQYLLKPDEAVSLADDRYQLPCAIFDTPSSSALDPAIDSDLGYSTSTWEALEEEFWQEKGSQRISLLPKKGVQLVSSGGQ